MFKLLLETGKVDVDSKDEHGNAPLGWAVEGGHETIFNLLLETGKVDKGDKNCTTLLWVSAAGGHLNMVERILQEAPEVNPVATGLSNLAAFYAAVEAGHLAEVQRLLREKADVNAGAARF
ncbi:hypothetical protein BP6252_14162 [Coleophoma cylindrospora]|uniref:Uncharacterized protein n=1 Tax=Coleophoma cylindrospora TaxID=1849047 RepID=A0A3D8Q443_9HELO|nr:hypothetical protein BP6252_14162 [Coleophoma cylindrospora]